MAFQYMTRYQATLKSNGKAINQIKNLLYIVVSKQFVFNLVEYVPIVIGICCLLYSATNQLTIIFFQLKKYRNMYVDELRNKVG